MPSRGCCAGLTSWGRAASPAAAAATAQRIKGNNICDICKAPIANLPPAPPALAPRQGVDGAAAPAPGHGTPSLDWRLAIEEELAAAALPSTADCMFESIRAVWIIIIVCILFLEMPLSLSFAAGGLLGAAYIGISLFTRWLRVRRWRRRLQAALGGPRQQ